MRVLIVEDTESVRVALRMLLEHLGHEVVDFAVNGQEALQKVSISQPDLVVMDIRMPKMDGLTCTAMMTKINPSLRVVVVTAGRTTERQVFEVGAHGFVEKPFDLSEFDHAISSAHLN